MTRDPSVVPTLCWRCQRRPAVPHQRCAICENGASASHRPGDRARPGDPDFVPSNDIERARHRRVLRERGLDE